MAGAAAREHPLALQFRASAFAEVKQMSSFADTVGKECHC